MEKFSVLMSVYHKEKPENLDISLKSIIVDQSCVPDEVVLVQDGPLTDELNKVVDKYKKKYGKILKVVPLKECGGLGNALRVGLSKCKYDLVARMDSDDVSVPNRFKVQIDYMTKHPEIAACGGFIGEFENDPNEPLRLKKIPITYEEIRKYAKLRNPMNHVTVCFRKKEILEVGGYMHLQYLEDHYLWARMLAAKKIMENIPQILVRVRIGNGFTSRRGSKLYIKGWKKLQKYMHKNKLINFYQRCRNVLAMYAMVYMPPSFRNILYNNVLRSKGRVKLNTKKR